MSVLKNIKTINRAAALAALASSLFATGAEASISLGSGSAGGSEMTLGTYGLVSVSGSDALGVSGIPATGSTKAAKATVDGGIFGESTVRIATEGMVDSDPLPIKNEMSSITLESGTLKAESMNTYDGASATINIGGDSSSMKVYTSKVDDTGTTINISDGDFLKDYTWTTK